MNKKIAAMVLGLGILSAGIPQTVHAAEETSHASFTDQEDTEDSFTSEKTEDIFSAEEPGEKEETELAADEEEKSAVSTETEHQAKKAAARAAKARRAKIEAEEAARAAEKERLEKRREIVDFALQFEGNPYVYGGTSLTNGADCSGFVMSVFKEFGYELPRVADSQYASSRQKDVKDIEPGDLVFYGDYGIDHVALYIGNGQIIHASTSATGIKISEYDYRQPAGVGTYLD